MKVLAIDPGREKCGLAVVATTGETLWRRIVATGEMQSVVPSLAEQHAITRIVLGDSTGSRQLLAQLDAWLPAVLVTVVNESGSTLEARDLYWQEHPPQGWRRLTPRSLQVPPEPIDDFAAIVLARRYFAGETSP